MLQVLLILTLYLVGWVEAGEAPIANTKLGKYKGYTIETYSGREVAAFSGIRYAQPPIDKLRFKEPVAVKQHEGVYDAIKEGEDCLQPNHILNKYPEDEIKDKKFVGSEDCLFLNIYTPNVKPDKPYTVIVKIHASGFMVGSGSKTFYGPEFLLEKDVILVVMNYRLNVFGFLAADDEVLPGNLGLKDQSLAIHWVRDNIAGFGGDPNSITMLGESGGAASVHYQIVSPRNKGVIQRAISQSGSIDCPWALTSRSKAKQTSLELAAALACPPQPDSFLSCLMGKTSQEIMEGVHAIKKTKLKLEKMFKPVFEVKETGFITEKDYIKGSSVPWLTGCTSGEGLIVYSEMCGVGEGDLVNFNKNYKEILPREFAYDAYPKAHKITQLIKQRYVGDQDFSQNTVQQFVDMFSDGYVIHGLVTSARRHQGKHYFYLLTHQGQKTFSHAFKAEEFGSKLDKAGVHHSDELFYLFPLYKFYPKLEINENDTKVQKLFIDLWTNFAIYGEPTPGEGPKWHESEKGNLYVTITKEGLEESRDLYKNSVDFWDSLPMNVLNKYDDLKEEL